MNNDLNGPILNTFMDVEIPLKPCDLRKKSEFQYSNELCPFFNDSDILIGDPITPVD